MDVNARLKMESLVRSSFLDSFYQIDDHWRLAGVRRVDSIDMTFAYSVKRHEMEQFGCNSDELVDRCLFVCYKNTNSITNLSRDGLVVKASNFSSLGDSSKGVVLYRHADVLLKAVECEGEKRCFLVICKVMFGRVCPVTPSSEQTCVMGSTGAVEPMSGADCHISLIPPSPSDSLMSQAIKSQVYVYEKMLVGHSERPRHCVPLACIEYISATTTPHVMPLPAEISAANVQQTLHRPPDALPVDARWQAARTPRSASLPSSGRSSAVDSGGYFNMQQPSNFGSNTECGMWTPAESAPSSSTTNLLPAVIRQMELLKHHQRLVVACTRSFSLEMNSVVNILQGARGITTSMPIETAFETLRNLKQEFCNMSGTCRDYGEFQAAVVSLGIELPSVDCIQLNVQAMTSCVNIFVGVFEELRRWSSSDDKSNLRVVERGIGLSAALFRLAPVISQQLRVLHDSLSNIVPLSFRRRLSSVQFQNPTTSSLLSSGLQKFSVPMAAAAAPLASQSSEMCPEQATDLSLNNSTRHAPIVIQPDGQTDDEITSQMLRVKREACDAQRRPSRIQNTISDVIMIDVGEIFEDNSVANFENLDQQCQSQSEEDLLLETDIVHDLSLSASQAQNCSLLGVPTSDVSRNVNSESEVLNLCREIVSESSIKIKVEKVSESDAVTSGPLNAISSPAVRAISDSELHQIENLISDSAEDLTRNTNEEIVAKVATAVNSECDLSSILNTCIDKVTTDDAAINTPEQSLINSSYVPTVVDTNMSTSNHDDVSSSDLHVIESNVPTSREVESPKSSVDAAPATSSERDNITVESIKSSSSSTAMGTDGSVNITVESIKSSSSSTAMGTDGSVQSVVHSSTGNVEEVINTVVAVENHLVDACQVKNELIAMAAASMQQEDLTSVTSLGDVIETEFVTLTEPQIAALETKGLRISSIFSVGLDGFDAEVGGLSEENVLTDELVKAIRAFDRSANIVFTVDGIPVHSVNENGDDLKQDTNVNNNMEAGCFSHRSIGSCGNCDEDGGVREESNSEFRSGELDINTSVAGNKKTEFQPKRKKRCRKGRSHKQRLFRALSRKKQLASMLHYDKIDKSGSDKSPADQMGNKTAANTSIRHEGALSESSMNAKDKDSELNISNVMYESLFTDDNDDDVDSEAPKALCDKQAEGVTPKNIRRKRKRGCQNLNYDTRRRHQKLQRLKKLAATSSEKDSVTDGDSCDVSMRSRLRPRKQLELTKSDIEKSQEPRGSIEAKQKCTNRNKMYWTRSDVATEIPDERLASACDNGDESIASHDLLNLRKDDSSFIEPADDRNHMMQRKMQDRKRKRSMDSENEVSGVSSSMSGSLSSAPRRSPRKLSTGSCEVRVTINKAGERYSYIPSGCVDHSAERTSVEKENVQQKKPRKRNKRRRRRKAVNYTDYSVDDFQQRERWATANDSMSAREKINAIYRNSEYTRLDGMSSVLQSRKSRTRSFENSSCAFEQFQPQLPTQNGSLTASSSNTCSPAEKHFVAGQTLYVSNNSDDNALYADCRFSSYVSQYVLRPSYNYPEAFQPADYYEPVDKQKQDENEALWKTLSVTPIVRSEPDSDVPAYYTGIMSRRPPRSKIPSLMSLDVRPTASASWLKVHKVPQKISIHDPRIAARYRFPSSAVETQKADIPSVSDYGIVNPHMEADYQRSGYSDSASQQWPAVEVPRDRELSFQTPNASTEIISALSDSSSNSRALDSSWHSATRVRNISGVLPPFKLPLSFPSNTAIESSWLASGVMSPPAELTSRRTSWSDAQPENIGTDCGRQLTNKSMLTDSELLSPSGPSRPAGTTLTPQISQKLTELSHVEDSSVSDHRAVSPAVEEVLAFARSGRSPLRDDSPVSTGVRSQTRTLVPGWKHVLIPLESLPVCHSLLSKIPLGDRRRPSGLPVDPRLHRESLSAVVDFLPVSNQLPIIGDWNLVTDLPVPEEKDVANGGKEEEQQIPNTRDPPSASADVSDLPSAMPDPDVADECIDDDDDDGHALCIDLGNGNENNVLGCSADSAKGPTKAADVDAVSPSALPSHEQLVTKPLPVSEIVASSSLVSVTFSIQEILENLDRDISEESNQSKEDVEKLTKNEELCGGKRQQESELTNSSLSSSSRPIPATEPEQCISVAKHKLPISQQQLSFSKTVSSSSKQHHVQRSSSVSSGKSGDQKTPSSHTCLSSHGGKSQSSTKPDDGSRSVANGNSKKTDSDTGKDTSASQKNLCSTSHKAGVSASKEATKLTAEAEDHSEHSTNKVSKDAKDDNKNSENIAAQTSKSTRQPVVADNKSTDRSTRAPSVQESSEPKLNVSSIDIPRNSKTSQNARRHSGGSKANAETKVGVHDVVSSEKSKSDVSEKNKASCSANVKQCSSKVTSTEKNSVSEKPTKGHSAKNIKLIETSAQISGDTLRRSSRAVDSNSKPVDGNKVSAVKTPLSEKPASMQSGNKDAKSMNPKTSSSSTNYTKNETSRKLPKRESTDANVNVHKSRLAGHGTGSEVSSSKCFVAAEETGSNAADKHQGDPSYRAKSSKPSVDEHKATSKDHSKAQTAAKLDSSALPEKSQPASQALDKEVGRMQSDLPADAGKVDSAAEMLPKCQGSRTPRCDTEQKTIKTAEVKSYDESKMDVQVAAELADDKIASFSKPDFNERPLPCSHEAKAPVMFRRHSAQGETARVDRPRTASCDMVKTLPESVVSDSPRRHSLQGEHHSPVDSKQQTSSKTSQHAVPSGSRKDPVKNSSTAGQSSVIQKNQSDKICRFAPKNPVSNQKFFGQISIKSEAFKSAAALDDFQWAAPKVRKPEIQSAGKESSNPLDTILMSQCELLGVSMVKHQNMQPVVSKTDPQTKNCSSLPMKIEIDASTALTLEAKCEENVGPDKLVESETSKLTVDTRKILAPADKIDICKSELIDTSWQLGRTSSSPVKQRRHSSHSEKLLSPSSKDTVLTWRNISSKWPEASRNRDVPVGASVSECVDNTSAVACCIDRLAAVPEDRATRLGEQFEAELNTAIQEIIRLRTYSSQLNDLDEHEMRDLINDHLVDGDVEREVSLELRLFSLQRDINRAISEMDSIKNRFDPTCPSTSLDRDYERVERRLNILCVRRDLYYFRFNQLHRYHKSKFILTIPHELRFQCEHGRSMSAEGVLMSVCDQTLALDDCVRLAALTQIISDVRSIPRRPLPDELLVKLGWMHSERKKLLERICCSTMEKKDQVVNSYSDKLALYRSVKLCLDSRSDEKSQCLKQFVADNIGKLHHFIGVLKRSKCTSSENGSHSKDCVPKPVGTHAKKREKVNKLKRKKILATLSDIIEMKKRRVTEEVCTDLTACSSSEEGESSFQTESESPDKEDGNNVCEEKCSVLKPHVSLSLGSPADLDKKVDLDTRTIVGELNPRVETPLPPGSTSVCESGECEPEKELAAAANSEAFRPADQRRFFNTPKYRGKPTFKNGRLSVSRSRPYWRQSRFSDRSFSQEPDRLEMEDDVKLTLPPRDVDYRYRSSSRPPETNAHRASRDRRIAAQDGLLGRNPFEQSEDRLEFRAALLFGQMNAGQARRSAERDQFDARQMIESRLIYRQSSRSPLSPPAPSVPWQPTSPNSGIGEEYEDEFPNEPLTYTSPPPRRFHQRGHGFRGRFNGKSRRGFQPYGFSCNDRQPSKYNADSFSTDEANNEGQRFGRGGRGGYFKKSWRR